MLRCCLVAAVTLMAACKDEPPACKMIADVNCGTLYVPTFDNVYANTLSQSCGNTKSACHSAAGHQGGMSFEDEAHAYAALTEAGKNRVEPGDPECSLLIVRTNSPGADYQMPPGDPLDMPTRCALIQWVEKGAPGPGQPLVDAGVDPVDAP
jgi:hypothetical protein